MVHFKTLRFILPHSRLFQLINKNSFDATDIDVRKSVSHFV